MTGINGETMSQQDELQAAERERANRRRILSIAAGSGIVVIGVLVILYAWQLWPFTSAIQSTENAYVRGQVTFISPQVNGYLTSVEVIDLQPVKKGQLLMTIDDRIYRQRVHQAQAQLAMKQAALNNNLQQRRSAEATIQSNKAALENAKAQALKSGFDLKRVENLTADGSLSVRERDAARAADAQAQAQVRQAAAQIAVAQQNLQTVIVNRDALKGDVDSARAALELAEIDLANTRITAPDDGQLGQLAVRTGAYVTAGTRLTSVVPNHKWIIANLKETQLANIRPGLPVTIRVDALDGKRFTGQVEFRPTTPPVTSLKLRSAFRFASASMNRICISYARVCRSKSTSTPPHNPLVRVRHDAAQLNSKRTDTPSDRLCHAG
jgi:multidrug resistance efflux pump